MNFTIDLIALLEFTSQDPLVSLGFIIKSVWWLLPVFLIPAFSYDWYLEKKKQEYEKNLNFILLAIDIPQEIEPNLKAVEQIFSHFSGLYDKGTLYERYFLGHFQPRISLEIISIEGYVQFLIYTPTKFRDFIESAIYAQYPDAEITEVEDYTNIIPLDFSREKYSLWGTEFKLEKKEVYPIRTYPYFEYSLSQLLADPMAALLEIMNKLKKGERLWIQLVIAPPMTDDWKKKARAVVEQIVRGKKPPSPIESVLDIPSRVVQGVGESFTAFPGGETLWGPAGTEKEKDKELPLIGGRIMNLTPGDRSVIEGIQQKVAKIGFKTKFRMVYFAPKEVFQKGRGVAAVIGAIKQFNTQDANAFKIDRKVVTKAHYLFVKRRLKIKQRRVLRRFKKRYGSQNMGFILNTEELASIYHFPVLTVKAPLVKKAQAKKGGPPVSLHTAEDLPKTSPSTSSGQKGAAPQNLPLK